MEGHRGELGMERAESARVRAARVKPRLANILRQLHAGRSPDEGAASA